ncbi:MAG: BamA/TamA family outer membrane protein, partial [Gammaproteobacteria bacterium]|nr:BamA/TamA family outer membrane protein [Gammaproteobacteria bacterium]
MIRCSGVVPIAPASWSALLFCGVLLCVQGCSLLPKSEPAEATESSPVAGSQSSAKRPAFEVDVRAPDSVRDYLSRNLEIQRYKQLDELGAAEISRLMVAAEANARELLNTQGYFTPTLKLELKDTPTAKATRLVTIDVQPGEQTKVSNVQIGFEGPAATDPPAEAQRDGIRTDWPLRAGQPFTQSGWDAAKNIGLRRLTAKRYPTGNIEKSTATIDADRSEAALAVTYKSGPLFRFGALQVRGSERYDPDGARRIAQVPFGADYDQQTLLDAQQRLASSGYYDSVFLTLDTDGTDPLAAPVIAQVREAPYQKVVLGAGFTTDSGPRVSVDHIHNQMPLLGWRAVSKLSIDRETQSLGTEWNDIPDDSGWRWFGSGLLKKETTGSYDVNSGRLRGGRSKSAGHIDRSYYLQYDYADYQGDAAPPSASAVSVNWSWTGRYFDDASFPSKGQGLGLELGLGQTLTGERAPFTRVDARWLGIVPLGTVSGDDSTQARQSRLQLRAEGAAVFVKDSAQVPATLLFLTGGDTTVRGYSYRQIGTERSDGSIVAGRYL